MKAWRLGEVGYRTAGSESIRTQLWRPFTSVGSCGSQGGTFALDLWNCEYRSWRTIAVDQVVEFDACVGMPATAEHCAYQI